MAELPTDDGTHAGRDPGSAGTPRWVKVFGVVAALAILLLVIVLLTNGPGGHGPGRHINGLDATESAQLVA